MFVAFAAHSHCESRTFRRQIQLSLLVADFVCELHAPLQQLLLKMICVTRMLQVENSRELGSGVWQQVTFDWRRQRSKVPFSALSVCLLSDRCWSRADLYTKKDRKLCGLILSHAVFHWMPF